MTLLLPHRRPLLGLPFCRNGLWLRARAVPSLDVPFADNKSLVDAITGRQLISYARAGSGTYTDSAGVLQTAATDVPRFDHRITSTTTNLAIRSDEFDNATWVQTGLNAFGNGSVANAIAAPDGTVTGDLIEEDTSTGFHRVSQTLISGTVEAGTYTASVYVKANQRSRAYISLDDNATGGVTAGFALLTQAFSITTAGSWSGSTASIEDVGNGWFRISLTSTKGDGSSALTLHVGIAQINVNTISYPGSGTAGLYVWGAQLVASDSKGQYVRTTAAAASFSTTESLGLLVEEQRTNFMLNSGSISPNVALGTGTVIGPDGVNCRTLIPNAGSQNFPNIGGPLQTFTLASGQTIDWAWSGWVAAGPTGTVPLEPRFVFGITVGGAASPVYAELQINTSNGTVRSRSAGPGITDVSAPTVTLYSPGLYRFTWVIRYTQDATGRNTVGAGMQMRTTGGVGTYTADGVSGVQYALLQAETGSTVSSTIPTTTAAATRNADVAQITGTNFSSWYRQDEGTFYSDSSILRSQIKTQAVWSAEGGTFSTSLRQPQGTANQFRALVNNVFTASTGANLTDGATRAAVAYSGVQGRLQVGIAGADATGVGTSDAITLSIGNTGGTTQLNGHIRRITYWPQRLSNATLAAITRP